MICLLLSKRHFFIDDEPKCDIFQFDDLCSDSACLIASASEFEYPHTSLELKPLPDSLKHVFFRPDESLLVIIASDLNQDQQEKLIDLLRENKEALGWTLGDIKGISPLIMQHRIHLVENAKPYCYRQRHLNPTLQEVVRKEVLK